MASMPPQPAAVTLSLTHDFPPGTEVRVCGASAALGHWDADRASVVLAPATVLLPGDGGATRRVLVASIPLAAFADGTDAAPQYKLVARFPQTSGAPGPWVWQPGPNRLLAADAPVAAVREAWYTRRDGTTVMDGGAPLGAPGSEGDPWLEPNAPHLRERYGLFSAALALLEAQPGGLDGFSRGYEHFGFTRGLEPVVPGKGGARRAGIWYREWAPGARAACLMGDFNDWKGCGQPGYEATAMAKDAFGVFSLFLPDREGGVEAIAHDSYLKLSLVLGDGSTVTRVPAWVRRAVYDEKLNEYVGKYWNPPPEQRHAWVNARHRTACVADAARPAAVSWGPGAGEPPLPIPSRGAWTGRAPPGAPAAAEAMAGDVGPAGPAPALAPAADPAEAGLRIYEAHVGMSGEAERVSTFREFARDVLPRIARLGYNCVQLMAIMEHAYYGSFGYHVNQFLAPSSRFGTPEDLKFLVDTAHGLGLLVIMDCVHSHANKNVTDGLNLFDGTEFQYFHAGEKGNHALWDSRLFDYSKIETQRLLLSSLRLFAEEFRFDGFRFDGVTSMMYTHHGLAYGFTGDYKEYFGPTTDLPAVVFLMLANHLLHSLEVPCLSIAEDVSGMPTLCRPVWEGGVGFDMRLGMAVPDMWIKLLKEQADEDWSLETIVWTLVNRRWQEKTVTYCESHDQALVGDKTLAFWLMDSNMYWHMKAPARIAGEAAASASAEPAPKELHLSVDRGMALHKVIRLLTYSLGGEAYLNFMGNEFGHPEWVDFPRAGNAWSYKYCRRQWRLVDDPALLYCRLNAFDGAMHALEAAFPFLTSRDVFVSTKNQGDHVLAYDRGSRAGPLVFVVNLHPATSYADYRVAVPQPGVWELALDSDAAAVGGHDRVRSDATYTSTPGEWNGRGQSVLVYAPCRTAIVLRLRK